jgi:CubicO group peptidase (beta-lactamase class C family)
VREPATPPLPENDGDSVWPAEDWAEGPQLSGDPTALAALLDPLFAVEATPELGRSLAFVAVQGGRVVAERYGPGVDPSTTLISWSMAKSVTQAAVGMLVRDGLLDPDGPAEVPEWQERGDPRRNITVRDLLAMRSGLRFVEDYVDESRSDCLEMLWGSGAEDVAGYAASLPLEHPVGTVFNYSSGTTNILSRLVGDVVAGGIGRSNQQTTADFLADRILDPLGMRSGTVTFDAAGTWVGSSYLFATARDFARFGLWYLRGGRWGSEQLLDPAWIDSARTRHSIDDETGWGYGEHWWVRDDDLGTFWASGYEGQLTMCVPALDLVIVRLGKTPSELRPHRERFVQDVLSCFGA